jgi:ketosteroid isomerase-like protein
LGRAELAVWVAAYENAWRTAGTEPLAELFTPDATYYAAPFEDPHHGLDDIAEFWEAEREGWDEDFKLEYEIVAVEGDTGVVRLEVAYGPPVDVTYRDLWIVRLDDTGHCFHFEEWPFWPERPRVAG